MVFMISGIKIMNNDILLHFCKLFLKRYSYSKCIPIFKFHPLSAYFHESFTKNYYSEKVIFLYVLSELMNNFFISILFRNLQFSTISLRDFLNPYYTFESHAKISLNTQHLGVREKWHILIISALGRQRKWIFTSSGQFWSMD